MNPTLNGHSDCITWRGKPHGQKITDRGYVQAEYLYNALGQRIWRYNPNAGGWENIYNDPWGNEVEFLVNGVSQEMYVPPVGGRHYAMYLGGATYFTHANALGSTGMITNQTGAPVQEVVQYPFGGEWLHGGAGGNDLDNRFAGMKPLDPQVPEIFAYFTPNRTFGSGWLDRWLSPDPLAGDVSNPQSLNRYAYVMNNPTTLTDPLGLFCLQGQPCPPDDGGGDNGPGSVFWDLLFGSGGQHAPIIDDPFLIFRPGASGGGTPGKQVTRTFTGTFPCGAGSQQVIQKLESNFAGFADWSAGPLHVTFLQAQPLSSGQFILIDGPVGYGLPLNSSAVRVSSVSSTSFSFTTVPGAHPFDQGTVTFSASRAPSAGNLTFTVSVNANFSGRIPELVFNYLGGRQLEASIWNHLIQGVQNGACHE